MVYILLISVQNTSIYFTMKPMFDDAYVFVISSFSLFGNYIDNVIRVYVGYSIYTMKALYV